MVELNERVANAVTVVPEMTSMQEVDELIQREQSIEIAEDGLQWHAWIVPFFNRNGPESSDDLNESKSGMESLVIMKAHHVIGDGLAFLLLMSGLQEKYEKN